MAELDKRFSKRSKISAKNRKSLIYKGKVLIEFGQVVKSLDRLKIKKGHNFGITDMTGKGLACIQEGGINPPTENQNQCSVL